VVDEHRASHLDGVLGELAELLRPELERGLRAVFLAGNHDRDHLFPLLNGVQRLVGAGGRQPGGCSATSRRSSGW